MKTPLYDSEVFDSALFGGEAALFDVDIFDQLFDVEEPLLRPAVTTNTQSFFAPTVAGERKLKYVGGYGTSITTTQVVSLNGVLSGGLSTSPQTNDLVVVSVVTPNLNIQSNSITGDANGAYTNIVNLGSSSSPRLLDFQLFYKAQLAGGDSQITVTATDAEGSPGATVYCSVTVHVWRGVDVITASDVAIQSAAYNVNGESGTLNPPAITPATDGAVVLAFAAGLQTGTGSPSAFSFAGMSNSVSHVYSAYELGSIAASYDWQSGAYDPPSASGGDALNTDPWVAVTMALRPAVDFNLSAGYFNNAVDTFYAPSVTAGAVSLQAGRHTNTSVFNSHTVAPGTVTLTAARHTGTSSFFAPTVTPGAVQLSASRLTGTSSFFAQTVTAGTVALTQGTRLNDGEQFFAPAVGFALTAGYFNNSFDTFYTPTVGLSLTPSRHTNTQGFYSHTSLATRTLTASRHTNTSTFFAPSVAILSFPQTLTAGRVTGTNAFHAPTVTATKALQASRVDNASTVYTHSVSLGAVTLAAARHTNTSTVFTHAVSVGTVSVNAGRLDNTNGFFAQQAQPGTVTLTAPRLDNSSSFFGADVGAPATALEAGFTTNTNTVFAGSVTPGTANLTPTRIDTLTEFYGAAVAPGPVSLDASVVAPATSIYSPSVNPGPVSVLAGRHDGFNAFYSALLGSVLVPGSGYVVQVLPDGTEALVVTDVRRVSVTHDVSAVMVPYSAPTAFVSGSPTGVVVPPEYTAALV